jgi:hypothetical protein
MVWAQSLHKTRPGSTWPPQNRRRVGGRPHLMQSTALLRSSGCCRGRSRLLAWHEDAAALVDTAGGTANDYTESNAWLV